MKAYFQNLSELLNIQNEYKSTNYFQALRCVIFIAEILVLFIFPIIILRSTSLSNRPNDIISLFSDNWLNENESNIKMIFKEQNSGNIIS
jgi:hypothetical protein